MLVKGQSFRTLALFVFAENLPGYELMIGGKMPPIRWTRIVQPLLDVRRLVVNLDWRG